MSFHLETKNRPSPAARSRLLVLVVTACLVLPGLCNAQSPTYRIAGIVVSKIDGHPLSRARITVNDTKDAKKSVSILTGDDGRFEFTAVPAGKYSLNGAKRGFVPSFYDQHENYSTAIVTGAGLDTENLLLKLAPSAAITGQILDESGDPVRNATISLYRVDHSEGLEQILSTGKVQTDDVGTYEFAPLRPGTYFLAASAQPWYAVHQSGNTNDLPSSNFDRTLDVTYPLTYYADTPDADSATPIPIRGGERVQVDLHLNPVPGLHLIFRTSGNGREGFTFPVLEQPSFDGSTRIDAGSASMVSPGVFEVSGIPAGRYNIRMAGPNANGEVDNVNLARDGEQIDLRNAEALADVKISARMSDNTPLPKQLSVGFNSGRRFYPGGVVLDEKGQAELSQLPAGSYRLLVWANGRQLFLSQVSAEGAEVTGHTVAITAGASVSLSLTFSAGSAELDGLVKHAGKPISGAMVVLVPKDPDGNRDLFRRDQSDLDGTFTLHGVIPGSYTLIAIENGWELDWSQPQVIAAYARHGQVVEIRNGADAKIHIAQPVESQPR